MLILSLFALLLAQPVNEEAAARVPLEHYLQGHATGDGAHMLKAFLPTAHIEGLREGRFHSWTAAEYIALFKGQPAGDESKRKRWIEKMEITGTAAIATLRFEYPTVDITDYMVLLKVNGE
jgi:hypothetical protein